jgi:cytochrome c-type biogenesis protein CcmH
MRHKIQDNLILYFVVCVLATFAWGAAMAQEDQPDATAEAASAAGVTADDVNRVARELWCPLCSGVRLDACELKACNQMKDMIAIKLADGEDTDAIKAYFVEQYGPQVLGEPPREGFNWLAWILPVLALVFGGVFLWRQMGRMVRQPAVSDETPSITASASEQPGPAAPEPTSKDDYERKLNEELSRYG